MCRIFDVNKGTACVRQGLRRRTHLAQVENKIGLKNVVCSYVCVISCVASACVRYQALGDTVPCLRVRGVFRVVCFLGEVKSLVGCQQQNCLVFCLRKLCVCVSAEGCVLRNSLLGVKFCLLELGVNFHYMFFWQNIVKNNFYLQPTKCTSAKILL